MKTSLTQVSKLLTDDNLQLALRNQDATVRVLQEQRDAAQIRLDAAREQLRVLNAEAQRRVTWKRVRKMRHT